MAPEKVKFWNSLVSRFALFFVGLNILAILVVGYLVYNQAATVITSHSQDRLEYTSNLAIKSFNSLLTEVANDIAVTTNNPLVGRFIEDPNQTNLDALNALFSVVLENKPNYFQIRLLDVNNNGKEVIRYDKLEGKVVRIPDEQLQFKGERLYYQEALKVAPGDYYYSDINLNEEFGAVSLPHTPTLRAVGQIFDRSQVLRSLLVINVDLSRFYQELNQIMEPDYHMMIINDAGDYLFASDMDKCFGSQLNSEVSFTNDFGQPIDSLIAKAEVGFIQDNTQINYLYYLETLNYSSGKQIYLVNLLEDDLLFRSAYLVRNDSFKLVLLACLLSTLIVFLFARVFSKNIQQITQAVSSYEEGTDQPQKSSLPENRRDELGVLSRTFVRMRNRIDQQLKDLKGALDREKQAIKERDEFLQNMSHEMRTPLNAILGLTRLLYKNNPTTNQKPIIDSIQRSATNLSGLMHDILDHQKLKEGKVNIGLSPQNFHTLLKDIYASYQYEAVNKGLKFALDVEGAVKQRDFLTDALRFNQIVTNLVVNAIKYTHKGEIKISARLTDKEHPTLELVVSDTGKGIKEENLKKIRDRFYREKQEEKGEGYGLGLSIVIQLVELFGGHMEVTSTVSKGSQFSIFLPLIEVSHPQFKAATAAPEVTLPTLHGSYKVLHIEDDPSTLIMVSHMLEIPEVTLYQVKSMDEARIQLQTDPPDLILSDLMLNSQVIDISAFSHGSNIPLVLLSAFEPGSMKPISPYFLQKPFDSNKLKNLVVMLLGRQEYDVPELSGVYEQYDGNQEKIRNFLSILDLEFTSYLNRVVKVFETRDASEWTAIMHKLTTHIKSLKLEQLSQLITDDPSQLNQSNMEAISNSLLYCQCVFRFESQLYE